MIWTLLRAYVRTHVNGGNKGPITLQLELKEKGITGKFDSRGTFGISF